MSSWKEPQNWFGTSVMAGQSISTELMITESYSGHNISIPIRVCRAAKPGPTVFVTAALHGDELNGTGAIRTMLSDPTSRFKLSLFVNLSKNL